MSPPCGFLYKKFNNTKVLKILKQRLNPKAPITSVKAGTEMGEGEGDEVAGEASVNLGGLDNAEVFGHEFDEKASGIVVVDDFGAVDI